VRTPDPAASRGPDPGILRVSRRLDVRPAWPLRLPLRNGRDSVLRCRARVLTRVLHVDGTPVVLRAAQPSLERVVFDARGARLDAVEHALERWRFALGVDDDLRPFYDRFRDDPLIGPGLRARPYLRPPRRAEPWESLAWAICEQLIETERAEAIERRIVHRWGRCAATGMRTVPSAAAIADRSPAELESCGLSPKRAITMMRAAREVASGRADLHAPDHERAWARLRSISGIGAWTLEILGLEGQGRYDQLPAGDLAYLKLVGRLKTGNPKARVEVDEARAFFEPYGEWAALAGVHALRGVGGTSMTRSRNWVAAA
jgi:3-methyladenine DNA glycosylase/8-oxoguanine DNA glycosylase